MEVNDVTAERDDEQPLLTTGLAYIPAQWAGDVVPQTSVLGNTFNSSEQTFSQSFMSRLARARQGNPNEFQSKFEQPNVVSHESVIENQREIESVSSLCVEQSFEIENDVCNVE